MRKFILAICVLFLLHSALKAQDTIRLKNPVGEKGGAIVTDRPPQAVYFQIGGSGPILSVNYDRRFQKRLNGLGFTAGLGFWSQNFFGEDLTMFSVPVSINYLLGRKTHYVELAAGTTYVTAKTDLFDDPGSGSGFVHHVNVGYRHQPAAGGFFFRGGFSPLFAQGESIMSYYLGFGYNF